MYKFTFGVSTVMLLAVAATSQAQLFDFEDAPYTTGFTFPGDQTSLSMTNGGLTVTITRSGGTAFDVVDLESPGLVPAGWGNRHLSPFNNPNGGYFIANFSQAVSAASIQFGDFGSDNDVAFLRAFSGLNGSGLLIGSDSEIYPFTSGIHLGHVGSLSVSGAGIWSIEFGGGSAGFPESLYWDNLRVTTDGAIPGPAAVLPFALGLLAARRRRR
jgi:MYXO-CTERM domain-containing protein